MTRLKILLAEDDGEIRSLFAEILEDHGHICVHAEDGRAAQQHLTLDPSFDLLITDYRMPRMDGMELLSWCREQRLPISVILISANSELINREKGLLENFHASFLRKPIGIDQLLSAVDGVNGRVPKVDKAS